MFFIFKCQMFFNSVMLRCAPASFWISWPAGCMPGHLTRIFCLLDLSVASPRQGSLCLLFLTGKTNPSTCFSKFLIRFPQCRSGRIRFFHNARRIFLVPPRALKKRRLLAAHRGLPQVGSKMVALREADIVKTVQ